MTTPPDPLAPTIRARSGAPEGVAPPAAIFWTDGWHERGGLFPTARFHLPRLLVLGDCNPGRRTGPAIWVSCVVDGATDLPGVTADGVSRHPPTGREQRTAAGGPSRPCDPQPDAGSRARGRGVHARRGRGRRSGVPRYGSEPTEGTRDRILRPPVPHDARQRACHRGHEAGVEPPAGYPPDFRRSAADAVDPPHRLHRAAPSARSTEPPRTRP